MRIHEFLAGHIGKPCPYCGHSMNGDRLPSRDHVHPKAKGGADDPSNILIVCRPCNYDKADSTIGYFYGTLLADEDPRAAHLALLIDEAWAFDPKLGAMLCAEGGMGYARRKRARSSLQRATLKVERRKLEREHAAASAMRILGVERECWSLNEEASQISVLIGGRTERFSVTAAVELMVDRIRIAQLRIERSRIDCRPVRFIPNALDVRSELRATG